MNEYHECVQKTLNNASESLMMCENVLELNREITGLECALAENIKAIESLRIKFKSYDPLRQTLERVGLELDNLKACGINLTKRLNQSARKMAEQRHLALLVIGLSETVSKQVITEFLEPLAMDSLSEKETYEGLSQQSETQKITFKKLSLVQAKLQNEYDDSIVKLGGFAEEQKKLGEQCNRMSEEVSSLRDEQSRLLMQKNRPHYHWSKTVAIYRSDSANAVKVLDGLKRGGKNIF